ncbi:MAG: ComEC/Rec2 family competence protein [Longimicrobiales bacterium]
MTTFSSVGSERSNPLKWFLACLLFLSCSAQGATDPGDLQSDAIQITFLDVGQGDGVLIRTPEGATALVDAGPDDFPNGLDDFNIERFELVAASHPHADHIGGMVGVINTYPVQFYMDNTDTHTTVTYRELIETLQQRTEITYLVAQPRTIQLGGAEIQVLPLLPPGSADLNNRSVGLVVRYGAFSAFLSGDSETEELTYWVDQGVVPDVTLLKAPHHGAADAIVPAFLGQAQPEVVVISVGVNTYGHPHPQALRAYRDIADTVMTTREQGPVTIVGYSDGRYEIRTGGA